MVSRHDMANAIRALSMDAVEAAKSGHPGMPMGIADAATALFADHMSFDPQNPKWPNRDRFVLSAGHGSMLIYSLLYLTGYEDMTLDELKSFRQWGAKQLVTQNMAVLQVLKPQQGHLAKASQMRLAWQWPNVIKMRSSVMSLLIITLM